MPSRLIQIPSKVVISTRQTSEIIGERDAGLVDVSEDSVGSSEIIMCYSVRFRSLNVERELRYDK